MDPAERAKQFMPFDALKGFREALREKERVTVKRAELSEESAEILDRKLRMIQVQDMISVVFYQEEEYVKVTGMVSRIDLTSRVIRIVNTKIRMEDICDLQGDRFRDMEIL